MEGMNDGSSTPPPVMIGGDQTVHLGYMRRDLDDLKRNQDANFKALSETLAQIRDGHLTRAEFADHLKADEDHERRIRSLEQERWKLAGASGIVASAVSLLASFLLQRL